MSGKANSALKTTLVAMLLSICIVANAWARTEKVLWNFIGNPKGTAPSSLISDAVGNLYGTSQGGGLYGLGTVFKLTPRSDGGWTETVLYSLSGAENGSTPLAGVVMDAAGNLYGTASTGGSAQTNCKPLGGCGTVFELTPGADGKWSYKVLHTFQFLDGMYPSTPLILDVSGSLFGTTPDGGNCGGGYGCGIVFKLSPGPNGKWKETVLYNFPCVAGCTETGVPSSGVIFDAAGNLYGTTYSDGETPGAIFELSPGSGGNWTESVLYYFCSQPHCADGNFPRGGLIFDQAGNLYGTTAAGGTKESDGVVFKLTPGAGGNWSETVLFTFRGGREGFAPFSGVVFDTKGNLYGTTIWGGEGGPLCRSNNGFGCGTVFELIPSSGAWTETVLHDFRAGRDGIYPSSVILDSSGTLYGTTDASGEPPNFTAGSTMFKLAPASGGWHETVYHFWTSHATNPNGGLISDAAGNLYGTTNGGGSYECGTVFEISPVAGGQWRSKVLYSFKGGTDGRYPTAPLVFDSAGNLYGTTFQGGSPAYDAGIIFQLSPGTGGAWSEKILHVFQGLDGLYPVGAIVFDSAGNLYGATAAGGQASAGTVFELSPAADGTWTQTILHNFVGGTNDGQGPQAGVVFDSAGNIYGTTTSGGGSGNSAFGTVFELSPGSGGVWTENILHRFTGGSDGWSPEAGLILDQAGNLYGTTYWGGSSSCNNGCGVVFELSHATGNTWKKTTIRKLDGTVPHPQASLVFDASGNLYGTASNGEFCPYSCGAIFELTRGGRGWWREKTLYSFSGGRGGSYPGPLLVDAAGNLYDGTFWGGPSGDGMIFEITP